MSNRYSLQKKQSFEQMVEDAVNSPYKTKAQPNTFTQLTHQETLREELPEQFSPSWAEGFVYKGVYFKMMNKEEGECLKHEIKALKYFAMDYYQNEFQFQLENKSQIHFIMPLMNYVENSSFIVYGTPIMINYSSQSLQDISQNVKLDQLFSGSLIIQNVTRSNLKQFYRYPEQQEQQRNDNNYFFFFTNVRNILPQWNKQYVIMAVNADPNINVVYIDNPPYDQLDAQQIKNLLGYNRMDIDAENLTNSY